MSELDYFRSQSDYDEFASYLDVDNIEEDFEKSFETPKFTPDFSNALLVDGLPLVAQDKRAKLLGIIFKLYAQFGSYLKESDIDMPADGSGMSMGFCFVRFQNSEDAKIALAKTQGFKLGKANSFTVSLYSDLDLYNNTNEEFVEPEHPPFIEPIDYSSWLRDEHGRDQFVIRHGRDTEIFWANTTVGEEPALVYGGEREKKDGKVWCDRQVEFSPQGTYFVTFHSQGIQLWGCDMFKNQGRFMHYNVESMEFSPCERYIITYSSDPFAAGQKPTSPAENIIVWSIEGGKKIRAFTFKNALDVKMQVSCVITEGNKQKNVERSITGRVSAYHENTNTYDVIEGSTTHRNISSTKMQALQDPNKLKWSFDGNYCARLGADAISVYDMNTPAMTLLDKKSFAAKDMLDFVWAPCQNMLSYWCPTSGNYPAMVNIVSVPDRIEICSRKCFDILEGHMVWHPEGDYLCVYMTKVHGKKKSYVIMLFRVKEPGVPVELIELQDPIVHVAWEPIGERIAVVHGDAKNATVSFYSMLTIGPKNAVKKEYTLCHKLTSTPCNKVVWSPAGGMCAISFTVPGDCCSFILFDVDNTVSLATRRHDRCNDLFWDPSGRMIVSVTTSPMVNGNIIRTAPLQVEDSFNIWSFQGTPLCVVRKEKLYKFAWRPRPNRYLTMEERKNVIKNLKKYEKIFEKKDKLRKQEMYQENAAKRNAIAQAFMSRVYQAQETIRQNFDPNWRVVVRDGYDENDDSNYEIIYQVSNVLSLMSGYANQVYYRVVNLIVLLFFCYICRWKKLFYLPKNKFYKIKGLLSNEFHFGKQRNSIK